ncbi:MAG: hypothetical protein ABI889_12985 [Gemmatimonadota bacterium]
MIRQESGRFGNEQNAAGSSQGDSMPEGQTQGRGNVVDAAKEKIQQLASQARETASGQVESRFSTGKTKATQTLGSVAQSLKSSGQQLRDQQQEGISKYADQAANKIEELSHYLENASLQDVTQRVETFARREPAWFIGSAVALGFLGARFLKSSQRNQQGEMNMRGFQGGAQGYQGGMQQGSDWRTSQGQGGMDMGMGQGDQSTGGAWQGGASDRDVTAAPQRDFNTTSTERQINQGSSTAERTGRA